MSSITLGKWNTDEAARRLAEVIRRQHLALATEHTYSAWLTRYCDFLKGLPLHLPSEHNRERFLTVAQKDIAASTQNQTFNAIIFFYKEVLGVELQNVQALRPPRPGPSRNTAANRRVHADFDSHMTTKFSRKNLAFWIPGLRLQIGSGVMIAGLITGLIPSRKRQLRQTSSFSP